MSSFEIDKTCFRFSYFNVSVIDLFAYLESSELGLETTLGSHSISSSAIHLALRSETELLSTHFLYFYASLKSNMEKTNQQYKKDAVIFAKTTSN